MSPAVAQMVEDALSARLHARADHEAREVALGISLLRYLDGCAEAAVLPAQVVADVLVLLIPAMEEAGLYDAPGGKDAIVGLIAHCFALATYQAAHGRHHPAMDWDGDDDDLDDDDDDGEDW